MYRNKEELALDLAPALAVEARSLEAAGVTLLQIDEPILSTGIADLAIGKQAVEVIASSVRIPTCMHVCGNIANVIDEILKYNVTVLDFEFSNNQANLDIISRRDLAGKMLGYGCVDSSIEEVETVPEIRKRIEKAVEYFDPKIPGSTGLRYADATGNRPTGNSRTCATRQRKSGSTVKKISG